MSAQMAQKRWLKRFVFMLIPVLDVVLIPIVAVGGFVLAAMRRIGVQHFRIGRAILRSIGVFPIRDHYYEPLINPKHLRGDLAQDRELPGIDMNVPEQLTFLERLRYGHELVRSRKEDRLRNGLEFRLDNESFKSGDAEYWYSLIRAVKPRKIIEIGSGYSTLLAVEAIARNREENSTYECKHICIEPYEMPWLEQAGPEVVRSRVELVPAKFFLQLEPNDILFIDSSHVIRPQGDVLFEYLELLPQLGSQVIVHLHDIFTPRDYLDQWIREETKLWNEQYLLEAFLTGNKDWKVLGALNFLSHHHCQELASVCPYLTADREPGSFYMQKL